MNKKLSICIPTYNREPYLRQLLTSLKIQQRKDVEIIVSDNASTDSTEDLVESLKKDFQDLIYLKSNTNKGPDYNFLACIGAASGKYCWFIGSDDDIVDNAVNSVVDFLISFDPDGAVINKKNYDRQLKIPRKTYNPMGSANSSLIAPHSKDYYRLLASLGYIGSICVRREKWLSVVPEFVGSAYVHVYICQQMIKSGSVFGYLATPVIKWRYENDSILEQAKLLGRLQIEFNYLDITRANFGSSSKEYQWVAHDLTSANIFWQLVAAKLSGGYSIAMKNLAKKYIGSTTLYYTRVLPLCITPGLILRSLRSVRRFLGVGIGGRA